MAPSPPEVFQELGTTADLAAPATPPTAPAQRARVFIDREQPLEDLAKGLHETMAGHGGVFLLTGKSGMGKTWLLEEFSHRVKTAGGIVAWGRASNDAGAPSFFPWIQVFRDLMATAIGRRERARIQTVMDVLVMPALRASPPARFRAFSAVAAMLREISNEAPVVIAFDDLHKADLASIDLLKFLAEDWHAGRTLVLAAYRGSDALGDPGIARAFREIELNSFHLMVAPFTIDDVVRFVEASTGVTCSRQVAGAVHKASSGNPRQVRENTVLLRARGALGRSALTLEENAAMLLRGGPAERGRALGLLRRAGEISGSHGTERSKLPTSVDAVPLPSVARHEPTSEPEALGSDISMRKEGDAWMVAFGGERCRVRDSRGMGYLLRLLSTPDVEVHVGELVDSPTRSLDGSGPILDGKAKAAYRARIAELREELAEAEGFNDLGKVTKLRAEIDMVCQQFASSLGLSGRDRRFPTQAERARVSVTKAIRSAIARIAELNPALGKHLGASISTGYFCSYSPDGSRNVKNSANDKMFHVEGTSPG